MRIQHIEKETLSDGTTLLINKTGKTYTFSRLYNSNTQAPDCFIGVNKSTAYKMMADEIEADVLELSSY